MHQHGDLLGELFLMGIEKILMASWVLLFTLQSCAEISQSEMRPSLSKMTPKNDQAMEKVVYVGLLDDSHFFHPWNKELLLSENLFNACLRMTISSHSPVAQVFWSMRDGRVNIDRSRSFGQPSIFLKCAEEKFEQWLVSRPIRRESSQGLFYLVESKDQLEKIGAAQGERYYWKRRSADSLRILQ